MMKDNSFDFKANIKKVTLDKNGAQVLLSVEDLEFLEVATKLSQVAGANGLVKITPSEMEMDLDNHEVADGQTDLID